MDEESRAFDIAGTRGKRMKKHAIIPVFISHRGCPNDCVFCNQKKITARQGDIKPEDARKTIEEHLSTLTQMNLETIEIAFFGGSFTGIPMEEQTAFLKVAKEYKDKGLVDKIHLSTRPDYINPEILDNLKRYSVDVIELGVQSMDPKVLELSGRGHTPEVVYESAALIRAYGFTLGIQLMIGLPGDSMQSCIFSAEETVKMQPRIARLYPTVVIRETELYEQYLRGEYKLLSEEEAVDRTKAMYEILDRAGVNIIRVGLKSSDIMSGETGFHPAFRQLVEGRIARDSLESQLEQILHNYQEKMPAEEAGQKLKAETNASQNCSRGEMYVPKHEILQSECDVPVADTEEKEKNVERNVLREKQTENDAKLNKKMQKSILFESNDKCYNNIFGHRGCNRSYFSEKYPDVSIVYKINPNLRNNEYRAQILRPEEGKK